MRAVFEHIEPTAASSWKISERRELRFEFQWHFHHEFELTLIRSGCGTRIVGDSAEAYEAGDLTLIGPEIPHTYVSAPGTRGQAATVIQFRPDFLGGALSEVPEFTPVADLLARADRGVRFPPGTADPGALAHLPSGERTVELLRCLLRLAACTHVRPLVTSGYRPTLNRDSSARIDTMVRVLHSEYNRPVGLAEVARAACMSPSSASRFFRRTTGITLTGYLNAIRISGACAQLRDTDRRICDIAADSGYANLANFNRRFRELKHMAPRDYRRLFRENEASASIVQASRGPVTDGVGIRF